jgi:hypothetical protein
MALGDAIGAELIGCERGRIDLADRASQDEIGADPRPDRRAEQLKACAKVRRLEELASSPSAAISGLAATCRQVMPPAITNSATR